MISNAITLLRQYGLFIGLYVMFRIALWKLTKINLMRQNDDIPDDVFIVKGTSSFPDIYEGNVETETNRIMAEERKILYYDLKDVNRNKDIKIRWELLRGQHFPVLVLNPNVKDTSYFKFIKEDMKEVFVDTNAMEVAISVINHIEACRILNANNINYNKNTVACFLKECLTYIIRNSEKGVIFSNNHYFFNLLGLLWITENIVGNKKTEKIKTRTYQKLKNLLRQLMNQDGSLYEGSTHYHKYVTDSLLCFLVLNKGAQDHTWIMNYAKSMYWFCCYASFNDNLIGIGDNDSGRILALPEYFNYNSDDLSLAHMIARQLGFDRFNEQKDIELRELNESACTSFGLFKLENTNWQVAIRCDQCRDKLAKKFIGSHFHNDQLSITAYYRGKSLFVDTGVYSYVQNNNIRLHNLKTASHNTVVVYGQEQNIIHNDWQYTERRAIGKVKLYNQISFEGEHNGYKGAIHRRRVEINEKLIVQDTINFEKPMNSTLIKLYFHLHPDVEICTLGKGIVLLKTNGLTLSMKINDNANVCIESSRYSPEYGENLATKAVVISLEINELQSLVTIETQIQK